MTTAPHRLRGQELLAAVAEGTAGAVGEEFLRCLARNVAEAFAAKLVLIAEADDPSGMHVRALACWYDGAFIEEPIECDTAGQPCAVAELHVEIADDGVGGADTKAGTGLSGLADRVEVLKGCFDVESPPGGGTSVHASIPLGA